MFEIETLASFDNRTFAFDHSRKLLHFAIGEARLSLKVPVSIIPEINLVQGTVKLGDFNNPIIGSNKIVLSIKILPEQPLEFSGNLKIFITQAQEDTPGNIVNRLWSVMQGFVGRLPDNIQDMSQLRSEIDQISDRLSECTTEEEKEMVYNIRPLSFIPEGNLKELRKQHGALMLKNLLHEQKELAMIHHLVKQYSSELGNNYIIIIN